MWPNLPWEISTCACGWTALYPWNAETPVFVWAIDVYVYSSELWRLEFRACDCVSMWGPAPSGYMSSSTPSRTRRRRVSSCMCTGSVEGQQPAFSRKLANEQLALRVSPDKQMVTVWTQGKCYQAVIISQAAICPPNRSQKGSKEGRRGEEKKLYHFHPRTGIPLRATFDLVSFQSPGECMQSYSVNVTLFFPSSLFICFCFSLLLELTASFLPFLWQRCRRPVTHPVLRGSAVSVSSAGVWMRCFGGVHSWRVSHPHGKWWCPWEQINLQFGA